MTPSLRTDGGGRQMSLPGAIGWSMLCVALAQLCVEITDAARPGAGNDVVSLTACDLLATSIVLFAIARFYAPSSSLRAAFGVRPLPVLHAPLAIAAGVGLAPILSKLDDAVLRRWPYDPQVVERLHALFARSPRAAFVFGAFVALPLAHEAFFEGALFEQLLGPLGSFAVGSATAILFACSELDPQAVPSGLALGAALGWMRARSRSVLAPALAHLSCLAVYAVPIARGADPAADIDFPRAVVVGGAVVALVALAAFALPARRPTSS